MWIVALALRRPYTFVVMALLIIILTPITILRTPVDIFPDINIPVISVVWSYDGMSPSEMADRIVSNSERGFTVTVNDIEHQESVAVPGKAVTKIFFRPGVNLSMAMTQVTAMCQTVLRGLPPGTTPPLVITYTASTTPIDSWVLAARRSLNSSYLTWAIIFCVRNWSQCRELGRLIRMGASRGKSRSTSIP